MVELFIHGQVCLFTKQLQKLVKFLCGSDDKESAYNVRDLGSMRIFFPPLKEFYSLIFGDKDY